MAVSGVRFLLYIEAFSLAHVSCLLSCCTHYGYLQVGIDTDEGERFGFY